VQVLRAIKAGARAYLLKNSLHKELLETIRAVHAGKRHCPLRPATKSPNTFSQNVWTCSGIRASCP
jgi:DNA-binding NarL/FixJ family response regulator